MFSCVPAMNREYADAPSNAVVTIHMQPPQDMELTNDSIKPKAATDTDQNAANVRVSDGGVAVVFTESKTETKTNAADVRPADELLVFTSPAPFPPFSQPSSSSSSSSAVDPTTDPIHHSSSISSSL